MVPSESCDPNGGGVITCPLVPSPRHTDITVNFAVAARARVPDYGRTSLFSVEMWLRQADRVVVRERGAKTTPAQLTSDFSCAYPCADNGEVGPRLKYEHINSATFTPHLFLMRKTRANRSITSLPVSRKSSETGQRVRISARVFQLDTSLYAVRTSASRQRRPSSTSL